MTTRRAIGLGAVCGAVAGLGETLVAGVASGCWSSVGVTAGVAAVLIGLWVLAVAPLFAPALRIGDIWLAKLLSRVSLVDLGLAGTLLGGLAVATDGAVAWTERLDREAAAVVVGGIAAALALAAWIAWKVLSFLPAWARGSLATVALVGMSAAVTRTDALATLGAGRIVAPTVALVTLAVLAHPVARRWHVAASRAGWVATALVPIGLITLSLWSPARVAATAAAPLPRFTLSTVVSALDRDRDGHPRWISGGDCDDTRAAVFPLAPEIPGNGRDENCCGGDGPKGQPPALSVEVGPGTRSIVVVLVDTLRADRVGRPGVTPTLDRLASRGVRFLRAYAPSCKTSRSIPALMTGRYPSEISVVGEDPGAPRILDLAGGAGFDTAAVLSHGTLAKWLRPVREQRGPADMGIREARAGKVTDTAIHLLLGRRRDRPLLLVVHYYDPHWGYSPPRPWRRFGKSRPARYDGEVAYVDHEIGRLLEDIDRELPEAVVAVTSDHGEEMGEHGGEFHARTLYEEVVRVPLLIRAPGVAPREVPQIVEGRVLLPSLLELAGAASPEPPYNDIARLARGESVTPRSAYLEMIPGSGLDRDFPRRHALVLPDGTKAIFTPSAQTLEIYDLVADPGERHDLAGRDPARAQRARAALCAATEQLRRPAQP